MTATTDITITDQNAMEHKHFTFSAELSELGIGPGDRVPRRFKTTLGNRQDFVFERNEDGVLYYRQELGCTTLSIFND